MAATGPLANPEDVAAIWHSPLTPAETSQVVMLIEKASAKLRQACPFDIDERIALFTAGQPDRTALDPLIVADVVATVVKRFLVNPDGYATTSETTGPYSSSGTFVNRYDKTGSDVRGAIQVIASDIDQLRPATPASLPSTFQVGVPAPEVLVPGFYRGIDGRVGSAIVPDVSAGSGAE